MAIQIQSASFVIEDVDCNQGCKFCVARMTFSPKVKEFDEEKYLKKMKRVLKYVKSGGAQTAIITSKGETLLSSKSYLLKAIGLLEKDFGQIDLHTNGSLLTREMAESFYDAGLTNITLSVPSLDKDSLVSITEGFVDYKNIIAFCRNVGLAVRLSCVTNKQGVKDLDSMLEYIEKAKLMGAHQIVFRELWIPENSKKNNPEVYKWSKENFVPLGKFREYVELLNEEGKAHYIFTLPWGEKVYDIEGMNITCATCTTNYYNSGSCGDDSTNVSNTIKSVVLLPDGHLYSSWELGGSMIF
ncbi:MAG: radical SAM protein [Candidatus Pacebacteria bacterium]|nr:radical SAM protein [Candidatus Paceibacterota bacterium]